MKKNIQWKSLKVTIKNTTKYKYDCLFVDEKRFFK